jgi:hypothetical protein
MLLFQSIDQVEVPVEALYVNLKLRVKPSPQTGAPLGSKFNPTPLGGGPGLAGVNNTASNPEAPHLALASTDGETENKSVVTVGIAFGLTKFAAGCVPVTSQAQLVVLKVVVCQQERFVGCAG